MVEKHLLACLMTTACGSSGKTVDAPPMVAIDAPAIAIDAAIPDAPTCGLRTGMRGKTRRHLHVADLDRTYIVYLPEAVDPATLVPLVFVHHGYTMSGAEMFDVTHYPALADREHIALAFPDGQTGPDSVGAPWNVGTANCPSTAAGILAEASGDDNAFLDAMKDDIAQDQCLDTAHVYVTGFSMGGYFAHHVGCTRPDIRAVAPHSGGTHALDDCPVSRKPIIIFHGLADPLIPDGCDDPHGLPVVGVTPSAAAWAQHNGCTQNVTTVPVDHGTCYVYQGCPSDGQVELCTFDAMGHCWAGGVAGLYGCADHASATQLEWDFFKSYAW